MSEKSRMRFAAPLDFFRQLVFQPAQCPRCRLATGQFPFCTRCGFDLQQGSKRQRSGPCAFCNEWRRFSGEDVFPRWLQRAFPDTYVTTRHAIERPETFGVDRMMQIGSGKDDGNAGGPYVQKTFNVCGECNNTWMSRLQNRAKPYVHLLAMGKWPDLTDPGVCNMIGQWAAMTAVNLEWKTSFAYILLEQRNKIKEGIIPPGMKIFVGLMDDSYRPGYNYIRHGQIPVIGPLGGYLKLVSFVFIIERSFYFCFCVQGGDGTAAFAFSGFEDGFEEFPITPIHCPSHQSARNGEYRFTFDQVEALAQYIQ